MVDVSQAWIEANRQTLLPETYIEIKYVISDPGAQEDAAPSTNTQESFSEVETVTQRTREVSEEYATLEHGLWGLDGDVDYFDGTPTAPGYVSDVLSGDDGIFAIVPAITLTFSEVRTANVPGLAIYWGEAHNEWAVDFRVRAWNGTTLVADKTVTGNDSAFSLVMVELASYDRIVIEVLKWSLPQHRARCLSITIGINVLYTKDDLVGYEHTESADLLSATLPINEISFSLRNDDDRWNPDNPTGLERFLIEQQELTLRYGMKLGETVEWIPGGTFWLSEWNTPMNGMEAKFVAKSAFDIMHMEYTGTRTGTLYAIATAALAQASLPDSIQVVVSDSLRNVTTDFSAVEDVYTVAEILQMVAHAGNCVLYQDRNAVIHIEPWTRSDADYVVDQLVSYHYPEYEISKPLQAVSVGYGNEQRYILPVSPSGETQTVDSPVITTQANATNVASRTAEILENRKVITGEFRADVRLDALDSIVVNSKYATNLVVVTEVKYSTTGGAFKAQYTGRVFPVGEG